MKRNKKMRRKWWKTGKIRRKMRIRKRKGKGEEEENEEEEDYEKVMKM